MSYVPLKLLSSMAPRDFLAELAASYQRSGGRPVVPEAAGGVEVAQRVRAGEAVDIVALASTAIDGLISEGQLQVGSRVDLARSGIAVAVRAGAARPAIDNEDALRRAVLAAKSLAYSTGPSGVHLERTFARWGILDQLRSRIVVPAPGKPVGTLIADGTVELGFQQQSELANLAGVDVLGPLPAAVQQLTVFSAALSARSAQREAAKALLNYLSSPGASATKLKYGMQPA